MFALIDKVLTEMISTSCIYRYNHCRIDSFKSASQLVHVTYTCHSVLSVHCDSVGSGRKALADANGIQILYDSAQEVIDCREMESLILLASVIMRKCCPRNKLPLDKLQSPFNLELPESELYPTGQGVYQDGSRSNSVTVSVFRRYLCRAVY